MHTLDLIQRTLEFIVDDIVAGRPMPFGMSTAQAIRNQAKNVRAVIKSEHERYVLPETDEPYKNKAARGTGMETAAEKAYGGR